MASVLELIIRARDQASGELNKISQATGGLNTATGSLTKTMGAVAGGFIAANVGMIGTEKVMRGTIGAAIAYEKQMAQIRALTGATKQDTDLLSDAIVDMAKDMPKSPAELGAGAYFILSSGITDAADAAEVLEIAARASTVGLGETAVVADALTTVLNAYQLGADQASRVTDVLMQAVKDGKAEASAFSGVLGTVVPIAAQMGVSFEEVSANLATFTRLGVSADEAATGLRGVMNALLKPSEEARGALAGIGMTMQEVREQVREKGLAATLQMLIQRFQGNEEALSKLFPEVRGLTNVLATAGVQADAYTEILGNMDTATGNLDRGFEEIAATTEFKVNLAMNRLNVALMQLGEEALPVVAELVEKLVFVMDVMGKFNSVLNDNSEEARKNKSAFDSLADAALGFGKTILTLNPAEFHEKMSNTLNDTTDLTQEAVDGWAAFDAAIADATRTALDIESSMTGEVEPGMVESLQNIQQAAKDARDALSDMLKTTTIEEINTEIALNDLELEAAQLEGRTDTLTGAEAERLNQLKNDLIPQQRSALDIIRLQKEGVELHAQANTNALPALNSWKDAIGLQEDKVNLLRIALGQLPSTLNIKVALGLAQTAELDIIRQWMAAGGAGSIVPMQHGGIVTSPTLALIGESGPEAVVPLRGRTARDGMGEAAFDMEALADVLEDRFARLIGAVAGSMTIQVDGRELGRVSNEYGGREADLYGRAG